MSSRSPVRRSTIIFRQRKKIFLALYEREYDLWNEDLVSILEGEEQLTGQELADRIAASLTKREQLLKLLAMNNYDMEANSRQELLTSFKTAYGRSMVLLRKLLEKFRPQMSSEEIQRFLYIFYPFMFGIYPYTAVTEKQRAAMAEAGVDYVYQTIYELTYRRLIRLLGDN